MKPFRLVLEPSGGRVHDDRDDEEVRSLHRGKSSNRHLLLAHLGWLRRSLVTYALILPVLPVRETDVGILRASFLLL